MTNEEILANSPYKADGTMTVGDKSYCIRLEGKHALEWIESHKVWTKVSSFSDVDEIRSLSDIRRIVELEKEVERLNAHSLIFDAASALNDDMKQKLEVAERERDEMLGMMATYEREFKAVCRQLIRISNRIMAGEYEDNTPEGMIYSEDAWVDCRWQDVTDPLFTSHNEALNKFAIEQQIKGVNDFANKFCGECDTEYRVQLDSDANYYCNKLRQQLNGDDQ